MCGTHPILYINIFTLKFNKIFFIMDNLGLFIVYKLPINIISLVYLFIYF